MSPQRDPRELPEWLQREVEEIETGARRIARRRRVNHLAIAALIVAHAAIAAAVLSFTA